MEVYGSLHCQPCLYSFPFYLSVKLLFHCFEKKVHVVVTTVSVRSICQILRSEYEISTLVFICSCGNACVTCSTHHMTIFLRSFVTLSVLFVLCFGCKKFNSQKFSSIMQGLNQGGEHFVLLQRNAIWLKCQLMGDLFKCKALHYVQVHSLYRCDQCGPVKLSWTSEPIFNLKQIFCSKNSAKCQ